MNLSIHAYHAPKKKLAHAGASSSSRTIPLFRYPQVQFGRAMKPTDIAHFQQTIEKTLKLLNKTEFSLIAHGGSFPSLHQEDTGFGSPNGYGAEKLIRFLKTLGFSSIQLGPSGKTKGIDASPYMSTSFSSNPLFIDLFKLNQDPQWGQLLQQNDIAPLVEGNPKRNENRTAYGYVYEKQEEALKKAFSNFKQRPEELRLLHQAFNSYKEANKDWLEADALYEALSVIHQNDYWPNWSSQLDKTLMCPQNETERTQAAARIQDVKSQQAEVIDFYQFGQFVADVQKKSFGDFLQQNQFKMLADRQVAFSDRDVWSFQPMFLPGFSLGCPPDFFSKDGQAWGFPVFAPQQLFLPNGDLGPGGKLLKRLFDKIFRENRGGVRIDHIIGLIDPWVYQQGRNPKVSEGAARLYSTPGHEAVGEFSLITTENIRPNTTPDLEEWVASVTPEQTKKYAQLMEKVVIQSAQDQGLDKTAIICEDLGTLTTPVKEVLKQLNLSGVRVTQFVEPDVEKSIFRGKNVAPHHWVMIGTHDNESLISWAEGLFSKNQAEAHAKQLAEDLAPTPEEKQSLFQQILSSPKALMKAKFAELFASPSQKIQVFFTDLFGLKETYNRPGTSGDANWSLRIPNDYESVYYDNLEKQLGMNLPDALLMALSARKLDQNLTPEVSTLIADLKRYRDQLQNAAVTA
jgi:4-alpha-glucanotransferase